jgi:hypothetical protein
MRFARQLYSFCQGQKTLKQNTGNCDQGCFQWRIEALFFVTWKLLRQFNVNHDGIPSRVAYCCEEIPFLIFLSFHNGSSAV